MSLITIETEAFQLLMKKMEEIESKLDTQIEPNALPEKWFDNQEVCQILHVSKRQLQFYRDTGQISYSQIGAKIYYRAQDLQDYLMKHYKPAAKNQTSKQ